MTKNIKTQEYYFYLPAKVRDKCQGINKKACDVIPGACCVGKLCQCEAGLRASQDRTSCETIVCKAGNTLSENKRQCVPGMVNSGR